MTAPPVPDFWPSPTDVAALLRARTQDDQDVEVGDWTDTTRPTVDQVIDLIARAAALVSMRTGALDALPCANADSIREATGYAISIQTAMLIELSYYPEQVDTPRSAYEHYRDLYAQTLDELLRGIESCWAAGAGGEPQPEGVPESPSWFFMPDCGGLVGWRTRW